MNVAGPSWRRCCRALCPESVQRQLHFSTQHQERWRGPGCAVLAGPVVHQGLVECCLERTPLSHVCSDAVLKALVEPLHASVSLGVVICCANVLYPPPPEKPG